MTAAALKESRRCTRDGIRGPIDDGNRLEMESEARQHRPDDDGFLTLHSFSPGGFYVRALHWECELASKADIASVIAQILIVDKSNRISAWERAPTPCSFAHGN